MPNVRNYEASAVACENKETRRARINFIKENSIQLGKDIMPLVGVLLGGGSGHDSGEWSKYE